MATRTTYTPGTFSWTDLTTPDQERANPDPTASCSAGKPTTNRFGEGAYYSMMELAGHQVAAISPQPQQQRDAGAPPVWNSYVTVESADTALAPCGRAGRDCSRVRVRCLQHAGRMGVVGIRSARSSWCGSPSARLAPRW